MLYTLSTYYCKISSFTLLGHFLPAVFVITLGYVGCNSTAAIVLLTLCIGFTGLCGAGFLVNFLDIAPQFAGT